MSPATARRLTAGFTGTGLLVGAALGTLLALTVHPAPRTTAAAEVTAASLTG